MKKLISLFLVLCLSLSFVVLTSCDDENSHQHEFATELSYDEDYHWYACKSKNCNAQEDVDAHEFEDFETDNGKSGQKCKVCDYFVEDSAAPHTCDFSTEYSKGTSTHWFACTVDGCSKRSNVQDHIYDSPEIVQEADKITRTYTCAICEYSYTQETVIDTVIKNEVSWNQAFDNLELVNFSMFVYFKGPGITRTNHCKVTPTSAYYHIDGSREFYTIKNADGTCTTYDRNSGAYNDSYSGFILRSDTSDTYLKGAQTETVINVSYADYYELFTYDESQGAYIYDGEVECTAYKFDGTEYDAKLICYNNVVKVADGQITHVSADYYFEGRQYELPEGYSQSFEYYNIGITELTIPHNVIQNATAENDINE